MWWPMASNLLFTVSLSSPAAGGPDLAGSASLSRRPSPSTKPTRPRCLLRLRPPPAPPHHAQVRGRARRENARGGGRGQGTEVATMRSFEPCLRKRGLEEPEPPVPPRGGRGPLQGHGARTAGGRREQGHDPGYLLWMA